MFICYYAILLCVQFIEQQEILRKAVWIFTDSKAALALLDRPVTNSKLVGDCKKALYRLASRTTIILSWVPGHSGIQGNDMADELAKEGCLLPDPGRPPIGIPLCEIKEVQYSG